MFITVSLDQPGNGVLTHLGLGSYDPKHGVYTVSGTAADVTTALEGLVFAPTAHQVAPGGAVLTNFTVSIDDGHGGTVSDSTTFVIVSATDDAPALTGTVAAQALTDADTASLFSSVQVTDVDIGKIESVTVSLDQPGNGVLMHLGLGSYDPEHGVYTVSGTAADVTTALEGLVFAPTAHQVAPGGAVLTNFTVSIDDGHGGTVSDSTTFVIVSATDDAPALTGTVAAQALTDADTASLFSSVQVTDVDIGKIESVTVSLDQPGNGVLMHLGLGSYDPEHGVYTVSGTAADVTTALEGLVFAPTAHQVAPGGAVLTNFTVSIDDGHGGTVSDSTTFVIVSATDDAPALTGTVAAQALTDADTASLFSSVQVTDVDIGKIESVTVSLDQPGNGVLTHLGLGSYDPEHGVYTVSGTAADVTTALEGLVFAPTAHQVAPGGAVLTNFTVSIDDGHGGTVSDSTTFVIVSATDDAPALTGTVAAQALTDADTASLFSSVQVTDVDIGKIESVTVSLDQPGNGVLMHLGLGSYDPEHGVYTVSGTAADVTTALEGLVFAPTAHQVAPGGAVLTNFTVSIDDGHGGTVSDSTTFVIVSATDDAPALTGTVAAQALTDADTASLFSSVQVTDVDIGKIESVTVSLDQPGNGVLTHLGLGSYDPEHGVYTVSGTAADVTTALEGLVFAPTAHQVAPGGAVLTNFTVSIDDGHGGTVSDSTTFVIVSATDDAPALTGTVAAQTLTDADTASLFSTLAISSDRGDVEFASVRLNQPGDGVLTHLGLGSYDPKHGVYTVSGTAADVTTALRGLVFAPTAHQVAPGGTVLTNFTVSIDDGHGGHVQDSRTSVLATAVDNPPVISGIQTGQAITDASVISPFAKAQVSDPDKAATESVTVAMNQPGDGVLTHLGLGSYDPKHGVYTVSGTAADVTTALRGLVFAPTAHQVAPGGTVLTNFTVSIDDGHGGHVQDSRTSVLATAVDNPPVISGIQTGQAITDASVISPFAKAQVSDPDKAATESVTVAMNQPGDGVLTHLGLGSYDPKHGVYTVSGTAADVTTALRGLVFAPTAHQVAPGGTVLTNFTVSIDDGHGGHVQDSRTSVLATAVDNPPVISGIQTGQAITDASVISPFAKAQVSDPDKAATESVTVAMNQPGDGVLTHLGLGSYDPKHGVYTVSGTAADVTTALRGLVFAPTAHQVAPGGTVLTNFTVSIDDGHGGHVQDSRTSVLATAVDNPPVISGIQTGQAITDASVISPFAKAQVSDPDKAATESVTVAMNQPGDGVLTHLGLGSYDPKHGVYTVSGTAADVTTALRGLVFAPTAHQVAPGGTVLTNFTVSIDDGHGGHVQDSRTSVLATAVDNPPVISGIQTGQAITDASVISPFAKAQVSDPDKAATESVTVAMNQPGDGVLTHLGLGSYDPKHGVYTVSGTAADVTTALRGLVFAPTAHQVAPGGTVLTNFTVSIDDGHGGHVQDSRTSVLATAVGEAKRFDDATFEKMGTANKSNPQGSAQTDHPGLNDTKRIVHYPVAPEVIYPMAAGGLKHVDVPLLKAIISETNWLNISKVTPIEVGHFIDISIHDFGSTNYVKNLEGHPTLTQANDAHSPAHHGLDDTPGNHHDTGLYFHH